MVNACVLNQCDHSQHRRTRWIEHTTTCKRTIPKREINRRELVLAEVVFIGSTKFSTTRAIKLHSNCTHNFKQLSSERECSCSQRKRTILANCLINWFVCIENTHTPCVIRVRTTLRQTEVFVFKFNKNKIDCNPKPHVNGEQHQFPMALLNQTLVCGQQFSVCSARLIPIEQRNSLWWMCWYSEHMVRLIYCSNSMCGRRTLTVSAQWGNLCWSRRNLLISFLFRRHSYRCNRPTCLHISFA